MAEPCSPWGILRRILPCTFPASGGCRQFLAFLGLPMRHSDVCLPLHRVLPVCLCVFVSSHIIVLSVFLHPNFLVLEGHQSLGCTHLNAARPHFNFVSAKTLFPNKVTFRGTECEDMSVSFGGHSSTHDSASFFSPKYQKRK